MIQMMIHQEKEGKSFIEFINLNRLVQNRKSAMKCRQKKKVEYEELKVELK